MCPAVVVGDDTASADVTLGEVLPCLSEFVLTSVAVEVPLLSLSTDEV